MTVSDLKSHLMMFSDDTEIVVDIGHGAETDFRSTGGMKHSNRELESSLPSCLKHGEKPRIDDFIDLESQIYSCTIRCPVMDCTNKTSSDTKKEALLSWKNTTWCRK